jgi:DNA polymerase
MTCKHCNLCLPTQICGKGSPEAKIIVLGDYPNKEDEKTGEPFSFGMQASKDYPGKLLRGAIANGLNLNLYSEVYMAYALRCNPFHRSQKIKVKTSHVIACKENNLEPELSKIPAPIILAAGNYAVSSVLPDLKGSFISHRGKWFETEFGGHKRLIRVTFPPNVVQRYSLYESFENNGNITKGKPIAPVGSCRWMFIQDLKAVKQKIQELTEKGVI